MRVVKGKGKTRIIPIVMHPHLVAISCRAIDSRKRTHLFSRSVREILRNLLAYKQKKKQVIRALKGATALLQHQHFQSLRIRFANNAPTYAPIYVVLPFRCTCFLWRSESWRCISLEYPDRTEAWNTTLASGRTSKELLDSTACKITTLRSS
jgi:hypothetical protein